VSAAFETPTEVTAPAARVLGLKPGELVRVRSASEIFSTLDEKGMLDGLPFMPEMLKYCGRTLPVTQRADTTCAGDGRAWAMADAVHLRAIRCDGSFHDGCQAGCLMFWKEAWLERVEKASDARPRALTEDEQTFVDDTLLPATRVETEDASAAPLYRCQATEIPRAARLIRLRELDQYVNAVRNWRLPKLVVGIGAEIVNECLGFLRRRLPERFWIARGQRFPFVLGKLEKGKTPKGGQLNLQPGDLVRIKSKREIVATLDRSNRNRGLFFDHEMARYCGRTARVRSRVSRLIEESNGTMVEINSDCIILEGVVCAADSYRFCTRAIYSYWREIWLERIDAPEDNVVTAPCIATRWSRGGCDPRGQLTPRTFED
jgi:hypothetical protein